MKKSYIGILASIITILALTVSPSLGAITDYNATYTSGDLGITLDGQIGDWKDIDKISVTLEPAIQGTGERDATVQATWNDTHVAFLITIVDDYDFSPENHKNSSALGILFVIDGDENATEMGGTGEYANETSVGKVDIWHWELDHAYGTVGGGYNDDDATNGGNDPTGNLDDEYATTSEDRFDDDGTGSENNLRGAYGHSGNGDSEPTNGTAGTWYFEVIRDLTNGDDKDVQFKSGETFFMSLAYWDPDTLGEQMGWTDSDHYVLHQTDAIKISFNKPASTPGFEIIVAIGSFILLATIVLKKRN